MNNLQEKVLTPGSGPGKEETEIWDKIIGPKKSLFRLNLGEILRYKDLLFLFVRRDFIAAYKQTILGHFWHIIQPVFTTITFMIVFSRIARIPTGGIPPVLFYLSGLTLWNFFSKCLTNTSQVFIANSHLFSKVYFPRLIMPLSTMISALISFGIQLGLLIIIYGINIAGGKEIHPNAWLFTLPLIILIMAPLGLGLGIIISSLTTRYRDLSYFLSFGVSLLMYMSPVIYPISSIPPQFRKLALLNPMAPLLEGFKYALFGSGIMSIKMIAYSFVVSMITLFIGIILFNRIEKSFVDTI